MFERLKHITAHSFGSLKEQSLLEIWTTPEYMRYSYNVLHEELVN
ncbi:MAG TPA: SPASM domain-containing protein [Desulfosporosinus sp.]|nr:SPASM domain-containing protein [Desulfosporosinus sp.]